jgi:hypothetical protein
MKLLDWIPLEKLDWGGLSRNPSPGAIELLEKNFEKIHWSFLSVNPAAIHLLEKNPEKIHWYSISTNQSIFEEDYQTLCKERTEVLREELMEKTWHPERFRSWCLEHDDEFALKV